MPVQSPPPPEYSRVILMIILLFYIYNSPDQGVSPGFASFRDYAAERIERSRDALNVLNTTRFQDFSPKTPEKSRGDAARYLNLTGFRQEDEFAWERLDVFKSRSLMLSQEAKGRWRLGKDKHSGLEGEVYENVTGIVTGRWVRYMGDLRGKERPREINLTEVAPGIEWAIRSDEYWSRNVTGMEGKLMLRVDEREGEAMETLNEVPRKPETDLWSGGLIREVAATMTVQDESSSGDGWEMRLHGVHWPRQGVILMTTTSDKFAGIFGLPHIATGMDYFSTSRQLLNKTLEKAIEKMENAVWIDASNPWSSSPNTPSDGTLPMPHCEYVVYVQVHPLRIDQLSAFNGDFRDAASIVHEIEQELRFPDGASIAHVPRLQMSAVMFSPDCGFMLESKGPPTFSPVDGEHLVGKKEEIFLHEVQSWLLILAAVTFGQVLLLKAQSKDASTPSTIGRVSLSTIAMMLMADALLSATVFMLSASAPRIFPSAFLLSFAAMMSFFLGARFIGAVHNVQEPERRERRRAQREAAQATQSLNTPARPTPAGAPIITAAGVDTVPTPNPTTSNTVPIIIPSDQDIDAEIADITNASATASLPTTNLPTTNLPATQPPQSRGLSDFASVPGRFFLVFLSLFFISLSSISWPVSIRTAYTHLLSFIYFSFWIPQIRRNIIRNCRKALLWKFVIGQSVLRVLPFAYFYLKEDNILFAEGDWPAFCVLAGWVWLQIWVLVGQEVLGPRWGIPKGWTEEGWDYHPILREDNVEAGGLPIGLVQIPGSPTLERVRTSEEIGSRKRKDGGVRSVDCSICMQVLEVPVVPAGAEALSSGGAGGVAGMLARRQYMVTPCRHVFHSACLEGWMRFRLQCPICRENLPPL